jgi:hypothetical protein
MKALLRLSTCRLLTCAAVLTAAALWPAAASAQFQMGGGGFGGGGLSGGGFGNSFGGGFSGGTFSNSFSGGGFGGQLGSSQGFRPTGNQGLTNRIGAGGTTDPFAATRGSPLGGGQLGAGLTGGMNLGGGNLRNNMMMNNNMGRQMMGGNMGGNMNMMGRGNNMGNAMNPFGNRNMMGNAVQQRPAYTISFAGGATSMVAPTQLATRLETHLQTLTTLPPSAKNVNVTMDNDVVVLRGLVGSPAEARIIEAMLRLEPGVYSVRNELQVRGAADNTPPPPRPQP